MIHSPAKSCLISPPNLVRYGGHYFSGVSSITRKTGEKMTLPGIDITEDEALNEIYKCYEQMLCTGGRLWRNEFLFRGSGPGFGEECRGTVWLVKGSSIFSEGIVQFRENTHVVFKDTNYGVMWKIIPKSEFLCNEVFDGCFTKNHDCIMDQMDMVNQNKQFGCFLDITIETPVFILWTTFS